MRGRPKAEAGTHELRRQAGAHGGSCETDSGGNGVSDPYSTDLRVVPKVAAAVARAAVDTGLALEHREVEARCRDLVYESTVALGVRD